ncbi:tryptophan-rich sensory protein [Streptomyces sp. NPDC007851]|uniref:tryptophan-rich sensory protein n=1 Tax=Streptomyces sp. NPDC007851 TaxID=3155008 RepID=UPI0033C49329
MPGQKWSYEADWRTQWPHLTDRTLAALHALGTTTTPRQRNRLISSPAVNLTLNAGRDWLFFARRSPTAALADAVLLGLSNAQVISRVVRTDKTAACVLAPLCRLVRLRGRTERLDRQAEPGTVELEPRHQFASARSGLT